MAARNKLLLLAPVSALAALLGLLSGLSLIASLIALPSDGTVEAVRSGDKPSKQDLVSAVNGNVAAARFFESARYRSAAASALIALPPAERTKTGIDAEQLVIQSLKAAPASPYNWNRLAYLRVRRGDQEGAIKAWEMSVLTGRYVPGLMTGRLRIGFMLLPTRDQTMIRLLSDQVNLTAQTSTLDLAWAAYAAQGIGLPFIRAVIWDDTDTIARFRKSYRYVAWKVRQPT